MNNPPISADDLFFKMEAHGLTETVDLLKPYAPSKGASWHLSPITRADAAVMLNVSARSIARASEVLDKADPALVKAVEQGRVTVSCATEIIKLDLDSEDTNLLMMLPQPDIPRNVERIKKEAKRREAFERMTRRNWRRLRTPTRLTPTTTPSSLRLPNAERSCAT